MASPSRVVYCIACGTELPIDASFCSACGKKVFRADPAPKANDGASSATTTIRDATAPTAQRGGFFSATSNQIKWLIAVAIGMVNAALLGATPLSAGWIGAASVNLLIGGAAGLVGRLVRRPAPSASVAIGFGLFQLALFLLTD